MFIFGQERLYETDKSTPHFACGKEHLLPHQSTGDCSAVGAVAPTPRAVEEA